MKQLILYIFFYFIILNNAFSQNASFFQNITTANGLPSNYVFCTLHTSEGFLWAGTDKGLCRYNGVSWDVWDKDNGLPGNYISNIYDDKNGGLWLCISEKGVYHFNSKTNKVTTSLKSDAFEAYLFSVKENNGDIIIKGINKAKTTTKFLKATAKEIVAQQIDIKGINKNAWNVYENEKNGKEHYFNFIQDKNAAPIKTTLIRHNVNSVSGHTDFNNFLMKPNIIAHNNWLFRYYDDPKKDKFLFIDALTNSDKMPIVTSTDTFAYVGRRGKGLLKLNYNTNEITNYGLFNGLSSMDVNGLEINKEGTLFISTLGGGINILQQTPQYFYKQIRNPFKELSGNNKFYYGISKQTFYNFSSNKIVNEIPLGPGVLCSYFNGNQLLVGSFQGVDEYVVSNNKAILKHNYKIGAGISSIIKYQNGWLISTYGSGFSILNSKLQLVKTISTDVFSNIEKTIPLNYGFAALSYEDGCFLTDNNLENAISFSTKNGLLSNYVTTVFQNGDSILIGCKNGISVVVNNMVVKNLSNNEGFKGKKVISIFKAKNNNIYILSDESMHVLKNSELQLIGNGSLNSGLNNKIVSSCYDVEVDQLVMSTEKEVLILNFESIKLDAAVQIPSLSFIKLDDVFINKASNFEVSFSKTNLQFKFKPLNALLLNKYQYFYKINNANWVPLSDSLTVSFQNLRPGNYKLWAKTVNSDGLSSEEVLVAQFKVNKPWWQQGWFLILVGVLMATVFYYIIQWINNRKFKKQLEELKLQQKLEQERQRISRDLHDNMGAYTSAIIANVQQMKAKIGETSETLKMQTNAERILESLRETIWVLNNKEIAIQDFSDAFKNYCFKVCQNFEQIKFNAIEKYGDYILDANTAINLNKILQEVIQNIIKHANASEIKYAITQNENLEIVIEDNGVGFDMQNGKKGNGLENMQFRANEIGFKLKMETNLNLGTKVTLYN